MNLWIIGQTGGARQMGIDFFDLLVRGGIFMIPIALTSLVVATFFFDRLIGLRRSLLIPRRTANLLRGAVKTGRLDPAETAKLCSGNSALDRIVRTAASWAYHPLSEIQTTTKDSIQREVDRAYSNVRWLNLGAGIAPLLGLLGTVAGLIRAFHDTTKLTAGQNRADFLAVGIYEALVTTLAGLMVAIPAAVASHYFEGRISRAFREIEELTGDVVRLLGTSEPQTDTTSRPVPPPVASPRST